MLLDPETLDLAPVSAAILDRLEGDPHFKGELPASQVEIVTEPTASLDAAIAALRDGRRRLAEACEGLALPAAAGVHPFAGPDGELTTTERYAPIRSEYGPIARRQLVASLQVHVAVGAADRTLAVYNALRERLPEVAALAANAAFYAGTDSQMASVRPKIAEGLPRQGVPPPMSSWDEFAGELRWGAAAGSVAESRLWWWELRPHPGFGTLEIRVPDSQATLADAAGIAALVHCLVAALEGRDAGIKPAPTWRIEENRWSAARHGVEGSMADLDTGSRLPTRQRLIGLIAELEPVAHDLGSAAHLEEAKKLVEENGAIRQRRAAKDGGALGVARSLVDGFLSES